MFNVNKCTKCNGPWSVCTREISVTPWMVVIACKCGHSTKRHGGHVMFNKKKDIIDEWNTLNPDKVEDDLRKVRL